MRNQERERERLPSDDDPDEETRLREAQIEQIMVEVILDYLKAKWNEEQMLGPKLPTIQTVQRNITELDKPQESREEKIARLIREADAKVAAVLVTETMEQRVVLANELERQARWVEEGEEEGSPYLALAARLRGLAAQFRDG